MELPFLPGAGADISKSESALGPWPSGAGATRKSCSSATLESLFKKMRKRWKKQDISAEEKVEEARYFCHALNFGSGFRPQNSISILMGMYNQTKHSSIICCTIQCCGAALSCHQPVLKQRWSQFFGQVKPKDGLILKAAPAPAGSLGKQKIKVLHDP